MDTFPGSNKNLTLLGSSYILTLISVHKIASQARLIIPAISNFPFLNSIVSSTTSLAAFIYQNIMSPVSLPIIVPLKIKFPSNLIDWLLAFPTDKHKMTEMNTYFIVFKKYELSPVLQLRENGYVKSTPSGQAHRLQDSFLGQSFTY